MDDLAAGAVFAGHRIDAVVGRGAHGTVYRATHLATGQPRALKLFEPSADPGFRERFQNETRAAAGVVDPHLVAIHEIGEESGHLFVSEQFVDATDLGTLLQRWGRLPLPLAAAVLGQVAAALDAAHSRGVVHGNLKPSNVLLAGDQQNPHAYLADLGVARPDWATDARADVYLLGWLLHSALTGSPPPQGSVPPPASSLAPGLPPAVDGVIAAAMATRPEERYPSAGEFARALSGAAGTPAPSTPSPTAVAPVPPTPTTVGPVPPSPPSPMPPVPPLGGTPPPPAPPGGPAPSSRRRAILIAVGAIAALLGVTAAVLAATGAFDGGDDKKPRNVGKTSIETTDTTDTAETQTPGGTPIAGSSLTIYSSLPQQGASAGQAKAMQNGAQLAIDAVDGRVGDYSITYKPLDDSLASTGQADEGKALQNARTAVSDDTAVGYIGEYNSGISKVTLPVLNQGGIAQVSPSNTYVGLTTDAPGSEPGEPDKYYPTGRRTYARIAPNDTVQAAAIATAAADSGCSGLDIWHTKTTYAAGLARNLEGAATEKGLEVHSVDGIDPEAPNYRSLAGGIRGDCFAFTGEIEFNGVQAMKDAAASPKVDRLFSGDGLCLGEIADPQLGLPAKVASRFRCTIATLDASAYPPAGKKFFEDYSQEFNEPNPDPYAINGYESMALLLDAIDRASQGGGGQVSRDAVVDALFETTERDSVLGNYSIDENGDTSITDYGLYKASGRGLEFDRVVKP